MRRKTYERIISILLAFAMVVGMMPVTGLSVKAEERTEIDEIEVYFRYDKYIPVVGNVIKHHATAFDEDDDRIGLTGSSIFWNIDDSDVCINDTDNDNGMYFEAGRTYNTKIVVEVSDPDSYTIAEDAQITLRNPGQFTYTSKLEDVVKTANGLYGNFRLTITMNGARTYPDITKVVFEDSAAPSAMGGLPYADLFYNNCQLIEQAWYDENNQFVSEVEEGYTYTHRIVLKAREGYAFDENVEEVRTYVGAKQTPVSKTLSENNTVLTLSYPYMIEGILRVSDIELQLSYYYADTTPISGHNAAGMYGMIDAPSDVPYHKIPESGTFWHDESGKGLQSSDVFQAGKTYYFEVSFSIKEELESQYRFAKGELNATISGEGYTGRGLQKIERVETNTANDTNIRLRYYFTAQFPAGAGYSASNPAKCSTYEEFKYAMEHEDIRYVALGNVNEIITPIDGEGLIVAINVNGTKNLMLLGEATFTAPASGKTYAALLHTVSNNNLNISGTGSLKFRAVANNSYNAVIYNQGGNISVDSGTLIGSFNTAVYGKAIWQSSGELRIKGGNLLAENALAPGSRPGYKSAVTLEGGNTWIQGGTFKTENVISTIDLPYGLDIGQNATVDLQGGTFHGICLPTDTTPLADYMDESIYTPLSDESWFDPNSQYSQEYAESGKIVRIAWLIDHADVHINSPVAGVDINDNYFNVVTSGVRSVLYYPQWYKDGELITYGTFEAGANYKVVIRLEPKYEYNAEFKSGVTVAVNNQAADVVVPNGMSGKEIIEVTYDFGECPSVIDSVELTVTAPKEGNKPSYTVGCENSAYYAVGGSSNYTDYRQWYVSDTGEDNSWSQMQPTDRFVAGKYYKFYVDIRTMNGYEFPVYDNGSSVVPDVLAMVNGYTANVIKAYDQDPGRYITVEYNFGECNDSVVENIIVMDVKQPVAGELPTYTYNILGSGYKMNTAKNAYYDAYWLNPAEKWYYIKNGIGWYDLTKNDWVYEHEAFIPGHEYQVNVYLVTEEGYEFAHDKYYTPEVTAMVNGQSADVHITGSDCTWSQQVKYTFTCEKQEIYTVFIGDLDTPKAGNTPDYDITTGIPEYYILDATYGIGGMYWYDEQGGILTEDDEFEEGKKYQLEIKIVPAKDDGVTTSVFVTGLNAMADNLQASDVYAMSDRAYLYFDYVCEAKQSVSVMGTITSFGSDTDDIMLQLIPKGLTEVAYETYVSGTLIGYIIMDVPAGDYILKITKSGHAVKECAVTVGRSDVVQDATLWLYGDGDHNGVVNVQDAVLMKKYLAGMNVEMDLTVANVNADTTVDTKDAVMLMKKLAGMDVELGKA